MHCPTENFQELCTPTSVFYFSYLILLEMTHFETLPVKSNSSQNCRVEFISVKRGKRKSSASFPNTLYDLIVLKSEDQTGLVEAS